MVTYDSLEATQRMRGEWKCVVLSQYGAPYAASSGLMLTLGLCVVILATVKVIVILYFSIHSYYILHFLLNFTQEHPTHWMESQLPCQLLWTMSGVRVQRTR